MPLSLLWVPGGWWLLGREELLSGWCGCLSHLSLPLPVLVRWWDVFSQEETVEALPLTGFLRFYSISFSSSSLSISKQHETRYPNLTAYCNRLKDRPSIKATWPPAWLENPQGLELVKDVWGSAALQQVPAAMSKCCICIHCAFWLITDQITIFRLRCILNQRSSTPPIPPFVLCTPPINLTLLSYCPSIVNFTVLHSRNTLLALSVTVLNAKWLYPLIMCTCNNTGKIPTQSLQQI